MSTQELNESLRGSIALVDRRSASAEELEPAGASSPMYQLKMQIARTGDLEKLKQLWEIEKEWRADGARRSFNAAKAAFKAEAIKLVRTKEVKSGPLAGTMHVELGEVVRVVTPALSRHGLSISWKLSRDDKDWMEVTCTLCHIDGHAEAVSMGGPPDVGPGRNAIQARGSAKTYLERYTATAILGLAPERDDDGQGAAPVDPESCMEEGAAADFLSLIEGSGDVDELKANYKKAQDAAGNDRNAAHAFSEAKNKMYRKLTAVRK